MSIFKREEAQFDSIIYAVRSDSSFLNAEMNLSDDNGFWSTLGTKCSTENQKFSPWLRLTKCNIVRMLFHFWLSLLRGSSLILITGSI